MKQIRSITVAATLALCLVPACGPAGPDEDPLEASDQALSASASSTSIPYGTVEVRVGSARHNGVLVTSRLVLTSNRWVNTATSPASVTITWKRGSQTATRTAKYIDTSAYFPGALITISPLSDPTMAPISQRRLSDVANSGDLLRCQGYVNGTLRYTDQRISGTPAWNTFRLEPTLPHPPLDSNDAGMPCFDLTSYTLLGFVTRGGGALQASDTYRAGNMAWWIENMAHLADVRARADRIWNGTAVGPLSLYVNAPDGTRMCMDIPWGSPNQQVGVNQFPCHSGRNQQFYLDYRHDSSRPQIVSAASGLCLDVPSSSSYSGVRIQQYRCHAGLNQRWGQRYWSGGGIKLQSAYRSDRCLGIEGSGSSSKKPVVQESCSGANDQRWNWWWR